MKRVILPILAAMVAMSCTSNSCTSSSGTAESSATKCGKYEPTWESLSAHNEVPEWLQDAKLGIYFHWGVYTVPAFGSEWYPFNMYREGTPVRKHHLATYGADFDYHQFVDQFTGEKFDAKEWAQLFKNSGAKFSGPCALHHDGFAMWASELTPWNSKDRGPKRDILGELTTELRKLDLKTIATFHHARNMQRNANCPKEWASKGAKNCGYDSHFAYDPSLITSTKDEELQMMYGNQGEEKFLKYWYDIVDEVATKYSPDMIWFDSWLNMIPEKLRQEMVANYYNKAKARGQEVTIGYKQEDLPLEVGILDIEQGGKTDISERAWMTDITISNFSWSYVNRQTYRAPELVLRNMIDVWSKNGIVLLNVSPTSHGVIPEAQRAVLKPIGEWLAKYGEAVYGTRPFSKYGWGSTVAKAGSHGGQSSKVEYSAADVRYTLAKDNSALYVTFLGAPKAGKKIFFRDFAPHRYPTPTPIKRVTLLGSGTEVEFQMSKDSPYIVIPDAEMDEMATVFKFELE